MDGFFGYHKIKIVPEDRSKTTFAMEWGCFQYIVMPFGLKNAPAIFSRIVVATFKKFIHEFLEVYLDDWTFFGLVKKHTESLRLMLDTCRQHQIVLNLKKCMFLVPFGNLQGHVVCKQGLMVNPTKIAIILGLQALYSVKQLLATLGHTGCYWKFIKGYAQIIAPMEQMLKKDAMYCWNEECNKSLESLKEKMASTPILIFPKWDVEFHVYVDTSCVMLEVVLTQEGMEGVDHPIAFAS